MTPASIGIEGSKWKKLLRHVTYDALGNEQCVAEYRSLDILLINLSHKNTSIKAVKCFATRITSCWIKFLCCCPHLLEGQLKHHFVEIETDLGEFYTLEKTPEWYLFQECPEPPRHEPPAVRRFRNGVERLSHHEKPELVVEDDLPKPETVQKIMRYLLHFDFLEKNYHLGDDNCQDFARLIWAQLSNVLYPHAGHLGMGIPTMDDLPFQEDDVVPSVPTGMRKKGKGGGVRWTKSANQGLGGRTRITSSSGLESFRDSTSLSEATPLLPEHSPSPEPLDQNPASASPPSVTTTGSFSASGKQFLSYHAQPDTNIVALHSHSKKLQFIRAASKLEKTIFASCRIRKILKRNVQLFHMYKISPKDNQDSPFYLFFHRGVLGTENMAIALSLRILIVKKQLFAPALWLNSCFIVTFRLWNCNSMTPCP